ncbi:hypothetical protein LEMLEM_LOCUS14556 [Lemmus lemmus]
MCCVYPELDYSRHFPSSSERQHLRIILQLSWHLSRAHDVTTFIADKEKEFLGHKFHPKKPPFSPEFGPDCLDGSSPETRTQGPKGPCSELDTATGLSSSSDKKLRSSLISLGMVAAGLLGHWQLWGKLYLLTAGGNVCLFSHTSIMIHLC